MICIFFLTEGVGPEELDLELNRQTQGVFRCKFFWNFATVALSFVFSN
jgi:hypothetical protein